MTGLFSALRIALIDMRADMRRFVLLIACLAVGTALIAGVSSVGASIKQAVDHNAAELMGGNIELSRADRAANPDELALMRQYGQVAAVIDTNVRAQSTDKDAFVDLVSVGSDYPLVGSVDSPQLPAGAKPADLLAERDGVRGALVDPLMLDQLGAKVGDTVTIGGTEFSVRGLLRGLPDASVRGFRLGLPAMITIDGLGSLSDRTSPLPGLGTWFRYKLLLNGGDAEEVKVALGEALPDAGWTIKTARDGLGPMVRYYDLFMRFLVVVGLASLLVGGISVWSAISAYVTERGNVIAILRSLGAQSGRIWVHFLTQVLTLATIGVGIGILIGGAIALLALPIVGAAVGVELEAGLHAQPILIAAAVGLLTALAFSYLPLQQAQAVSPVDLFRSKGLVAPPLEWSKLFRSWQIVPLVIAGIAFFGLATIMTGDAPLVAAFAAASAVAVILLQLAFAGFRWLLGRLPQARNRLLRFALRDIPSRQSNASAVVASVGLALVMLVVVLVLQVNLRNQYLGASVFDAPTFVASDLFDDEVATLETMKASDPDITRFTATPMLRGALAAVNGTPVDKLRPKGPEASFLLSGEIPLTFRSQLPESSKVTEGEWWPQDYSGPALVSLHQSLHDGLGINIGDTLTFTIFGDAVTAKVASFRDYAWQGGIDFLATFSPGVLDAYPSTLLAAVTAASGREDDVQIKLANALPDVRFIAIGETLEQIAIALSQLSLAAATVGGLAVGNGLLVLIGSLATGRRQRQADAVINKVLGATRFDVLAVSVLHFAILAAFAAVIATPLGIGLAYVLVRFLLDVDFTLDPTVLLAVDLGAIAITGILGATTIIRAISIRPALFLRTIATE